jgi:hypothetical protein
MAIKILSAKSLTSTLEPSCAKNIPVYINIVFFFVDFEMTEIFDLRYTVRLQVAQIFQMLPKDQF